MSVQIDIRYTGDLHCSAQHLPSGKTIDTDAPVDNGGKGASFSPTDLVATALGSCLVTIMGIVAQREEFDITGTQVRVIKEMAADPVRRIGALHVTVTYPKDKLLTDGQRKKLESAALLCPARQSLHPQIDVQIEFVYLND